MIGRNITGERFGSLIAIKELDERTKEGKIQYLCKCDCGNTCIMRATELRTGKRISCGCQIWRKKYDSFDIRPYRVWYDIKRRCEDQRRRDYHRYGGRGISVCDEWHDFQKFSDWAFENGYSEGLTIDRINNDGNYEPENCRWVNNTIQANNRSSNHIMTLDGVAKTMAEWSRVTGISYTTLRSRQRRGWSDKDTLTKPVREVMA